MATLTQMSFDQLQAPKKRGKYRPQFYRDPQDKHEIPLTERDLEILKEIYENRFTTFSILRALFPPLPTIPLNPFSKTQQKKQRRLAKLGLEIPEEGRPEQVVSTGKYSGKTLYEVLGKLYRHYYITRLRTYRGEEHVYALDELGANALRQQGYNIKESLDWADKNFDITERYYKHTLMIARFYAALKVALKDHPTFSLLKFERGKASCKVVWDTNADGKKYKRKITVDPDFFFVIRDRKRNGNYGFLCEADRSTKTLSLMLERYTRYALMFKDQADIQKYQMQGMRVLTICKSQERTVDLHGLPLRKDLERPRDSALPKDFFIPEDDLSRYYFANEQDYNVDLKNVLASIWHRADEEWFQKDGAGEIEQENTRAIVPDPLPRVKNG
jgi:hypothetical protein